MLKGMISASKAMASAAAVGIGGAFVYHPPSDLLSPTVQVETFTVGRGKMIPTFSDKPLIELGPSMGLALIPLGLNVPLHSSSENLVSDRKVPEVQNLAIDFPGIEHAMGIALDHFEKEDSIHGLQVEVDMDDVSYPITIWIQSSLEGEERQQLKSALRRWWNQGFPDYANSVLIAVL